MGNSEKYEVGNIGGSEEVTLTLAQLPNYKRTITDYRHNTVYFQNDNKGDYATSASPKTLPANDVITALFGNSEPHPNMPPYYVLSWIMKL